MVSSASRHESFLWAACYMGLPAANGFQCHEEAHADRLRDTLETRLLALASRLDPSLKTRKEPGRPACCAHLGPTHSGHASKSAERRPLD